MSTCGGRRICYHRERIPSLKRPTDAAVADMQPRKSRPRRHLSCSILYKMRCICSRDGIASQDRPPQLWPSEPHAGELANRNPMTIVNKWKYVQLKRSSKQQRRCWFRQDSLHFERHTPLSVSTKTLLVIISQLISRAKLCRITVNGQCRVRPGVGDTTERGEASVVQLAERDAEVPDKLPVG